MEKRIYLPLTEEQTVNLKAGDNVLLNGIIYMLLLLDTCAGINILFQA